MRVVVSGMSGQEARMRLLLLDSPSMAEIIRVVRQRQRTPCSSASWAPASAGSVDVLQKLLHLLHGLAQHLDVISCQGQGRDLTQLAHARSLGVRHDIP